MTSVAVAGTFDVLHDGHKAILKKAYTLGNVIIGLVSDEMAEKKAHVVNNYTSRKKSLTAWITTLTGTEPQIVAISDCYGPTLEQSFDYIVVSPETLPTAEEINTLRSQRGFPPIKIECVDFVLAQDGKPISSTRIQNGEIDEHGVLL
jgi:pantetheine-phosphate adenylyltransferase